MLSHAGKIAIEVGLNESVTRSEHRTIAVSRQEVIDDILACADAGAAVVHYHARNPDGTNAWLDDQFYRDVMDAVAAESDVLTYPTYFNGDFTAIWRLADDPGTRTNLPIAPFDVFQNVGLSLWDSDHQCFVAPGFNAADGKDRLPPPAALEEMDRRGIRPTVAIFDVGDARWVRLAAQAGILKGALNLKIFMCGSLVKGPEPSAPAIDTYLAELGSELDLEPTIVPFYMSDPTECERLLDAALERGLNVRVGLGDNPRAYPDATNRELVERVIDRIGRYGYTPATPDDLATRLGLQLRV